MLRGRHVALSAELHPGPILAAAIWASHPAPDRCGGARVSLFGLAFEVTVSGVA